MDNIKLSKSNSITLKDKTTATTLFKQEQPTGDTQVTYRIPALIYVKENKTFLAFAEKRKKPNDTDADVLVMRRGLWKDDKNEVEWVSDEHLSMEFSNSARLPGHRSMNPCPVYERDSKTLFLFFICIPVGVSEEDQKNNKKNQARLCYITSKDTGKQWCEIKDLTKDFSDKEKTWATFAVGPGHGVQINNNRLVIPAYAYQCTCKSDCTLFSCLSCFCLSCFCSCCSLCYTLKPYAFTFYSDDKGQTWKAGNPMEVESCECEMAEIIDDKGTSILYCNARTCLRYRTEALSNNSGEDFDKVLPSNKLIETGNGCQGSVLSFLDQSTLKKMNL